MSTPFAPASDINSSATSTYSLERAIIHTLISDEPHTLIACVAQSIKIEDIDSMKSKGGWNETAAWAMRFDFIVQLQNRLLLGKQHYVKEVKALPDSNQRLKN